MDQVEMEQLWSEHLDGEFAAQAEVVERPSAAGDGDVEPGQVPARGAAVTGRHTLDFTTEHMFAMVPRPCKASRRARSTILARR